MNKFIARSARFALGSLLLSLLHACTGGGGDDVSPLQAPTITPIGDQIVEEGQPLSFTVSASNDGPTPVLSVGNLPPGARFDTATGAFSWIPAAGDADASPFRVTFTATDPVETGLSGSETISITVQPFGSNTSPTAAAPLITPDGGVFVDSVSVSMSTATAGAVIFYTLDGSDPTENSIQYGGPFELIQNTTVNARSFADGFINSNLSRAIFTITRNETPVLNAIGDQTIEENQLLSFTVIASDAESTPVLSAAPLPPGATFDEVTGSFEWTPAVGASANSPYTVTFTATDADDANLIAAETVEITVNSLPVAASPAITPNGGSFVDSVDVTITSSTPGAQIFYTLDGSEPTTASTLYSGPFAITASATVTAKAFATGFIDSASTAATFTITATPVAEAPVITPNGGSFADSVDVTITTSTPGAQIFYTLDGSEPTTASTLYSGPFAITASATVTAKAFATGFIDSASTAATFTITATPVAEAPVITPNGGSFADSVDVTITTSTPGAQIFYTLDGSEPTTASTLYSGPFAITASATVTAKAFATGFIDSASTAAAFTITATPVAEAPVITPNGGSFADSVDVTIASSTAGAQIFYTLDGSEPTTASTLYSGPFAITASATVTAKAFATGFIDSASTAATFTVTATPVAEAAVISPNGGSFADSVDVTLTSSTASAQIFYTLDGSEPTNASTLYSAPFTLTDNATVTAKAFATGFIDSASTAATFTITATPVAEAPVISPNGGSFADSVDVTITSSTVGAQIFYTLDGSEPTTASTLYSGPFAITASATVTAKAFATGFIDSASTAATFTITVTPVAEAPVISPNGGSFTDSVDVTITSSTASAQIFYTLDGSEPTTASTLYSGPFAITASATVTAKAFATGFIDSASTAATFTITVTPVAEAPVISPNGGSFTDSVDVTITSSTASAQIFYTLDGSEPTTGSTLYSAPFTLTDNATVTAKAFATGFTESVSTAATFTITLTNADCTVGITSPVALDLQTSSDLVVDASLSCTPAIPTGWGIRLEVAGVNNGDSDEQIVSAEPFSNTFLGLAKDEYTVTATVVNDSSDDVSGAQTQVQVAPVGIGDYYVAVGDSITSGRGDSGAVTSADGRNTSTGYPPRLNDALTTARSYPHTVVNAGVEGHTSSQGISEVSSVLTANPDAQFVLVKYGMNDAGEYALPIPPSGGPGSFKSNMQQIINAITGASMTPVLAKINIALGDSATGATYDNPDTGRRSEQIKLYNVVIDELRSENSSISVVAPDFYGLFFDGGVPLYMSEYSDNIHPNGAGYQSMANRWSQRLLE